MILFKKKALIEASMIASAKKIEKAYLAASQEFHITLEGRIKDMDQNEAIAVGLHP